MYLPSNGAVVNVIHHDLDIAYTEDLPPVIEKHELDHHLYADDTQIADYLQLTQAAAAITNIERCVGICSCLVYFQTAAAQPYQIGDNLVRIQNQSPSFTWCWPQPTY